jgi:hypothetical protein
MSESMIFVFGAAFCSVAIAGWNWANHSAPTVGRVQRRRKAFLRAKALYKAEAAALQAYYEAVGPVKAQQHANELLGGARLDVRE